MNKTYKGWELLKAIADGEIKRGDIIQEINTQEIYTFNGQFFQDENGRYLLERHIDIVFVCCDFELISEPAEKMDIQDIEEFEDDGIFSATYVKDKINTLIKAIKQIDNKLKEDKK